MFVEKFQGPIAANPAHIYISALPLAPSHSLVSQHYLPRYPHTLSVKGGPQTWDEFREKPVCVMRACVSLDGTRIAAVFVDKTLCIYDTTTGEVILPPIKLDENLQSLIFSRDGKLVATGGQTLRLWNVETGEEVMSFDIIVCSLALSPDGTCIAAGCSGRYNKRSDTGSYNIRVINLELAKIPHPYVPPDGGIKLLKGEVPPSPFKGHKGLVFSVAYSPDGEQIASSSSDCTVRVWDVSTGSRRTFRVKTDFDWAHSITFSPDGTQIAADRTLINLSTGSITGTRLGKKSVYSSAFSADGRYLALGTYYPAACHIWEASTHRSIVQLVGHRDNVVSVAFFSDGKQFMSASWDGTIRVWDVELLEERGEMDRWQNDMYGFWIFGPEDEPLFWTPLPFRHARNTLVIGECLNVNFLNFVHGDEWWKCREPL
jgi:WD40 repeat protein